VRRRVWAVPAARQVVLCLSTWLSLGQRLREMQGLVTSSSDVAAARQRVDVVDCWIIAALTCPGIGQRAIVSPWRGCPLPGSYSAAGTGRRQANEFGVVPTR